MDDEPALKITISPEPTADERDAVVAALTVLALAEQPARDVQTAPVSRWARAGRLEAMGGIQRRADRGWGSSRT